VFGVQYKVTLHEPPARRKGLPIARKRDMGTTQLVRHQNHWGPGVIHAQTLAIKAVAQAPADFRPAPTGVSSNAPSRKRMKKGLLRVVAPKAVRKSDLMVSSGPDLDTGP